MNLGDFQAGSLIDFKFNSQAQTGASITMATNGTVRIFKNNSTTPRASASGITFTEDFPATTGVIVGVHHLRVDLSDNTDAGFYSTGGEYDIVVDSAVVDSIQLSTTIAHFSIERVAKTGYRLSSAGVDDILRTALTESYAADGAAGTLTQILFLVQQLLAERALSGTTLTVKKLDGTTTAATFTTNSATNPTSYSRTT